jgi:uncharacterized protein DUF6429
LRLFWETVRYRDVLVTGKGVKALIRLGEERCYHRAEAGLLMDYDRDKVDEMVLALLYLTITEEGAWGARAWKSHDWDALDRLHAKGHISDPKSKAKSVVLSPEGMKRARELFEQHFAQPADAGLKEGPHR